MTGFIALTAIAFFTDAAGAQTYAGSLPYTIGWYADVAYELPDDAVAFNGIADGDPYGIDIVLRFEYYVSGPMTLYTSKDGVNWTWHGNSHGMLSSADPITQIRLAGDSWDPDSWAKYVRIYNTTYEGAIVLTSVEPLFPGPNPTLPSNTPPAAGDIAVNTDVGVAVTVNVLDSASDTDGDPLTITGIGSAAHGSVTLNEDGTVTYTPASGFSGDDTFTYTVSDDKDATATGNVTVTVNGLWVTIDIKPGSYPNAINLGANGVVPVAILSTEDFDATAMVNAGTVTLGGAGVAVRGKSNKLMASNQDVNDDGLLDLVLHIDAENLVEAQLQDGWGTIVGKTYGGLSIIGKDEITLVPAQ
jgi:hypothetical protein